MVPDCTDRGPFPYPSHHIPKERPMSDTPFSALPNPETSPGFYDGVAVKRGLAWILDTFAVAVISAVLATLPFFLGWFFFPLIFLAVNVLYRIGTIASASATPGMSLFNIELRTHQGHNLDGSMAAMHTIAYLIANAFVLPQLISIALMLGSARGQGLHDMVTGVVALNRSS